MPIVTFDLNDRDYINKLNQMSQEAGDVQQARQDTIEAKEAAQQAQANAQAVAESGLPSQAGKRGHFLQSNGTATTWGQFRLNALMGPLCELFNPNALTTRGARGVFFSRDSVATYIGTDGLLKEARRDEPRQEAGGWLLEPRSDNFLRMSEDLSASAYWEQSLYGGGTPAYSRTLDTTDIKDPRGQNNAVKLTAGLANYPLFARAYRGLVSGSTYTTSLFIYVPPQGGITNFALTIDYNDMDMATSAPSTVFGKWVRVPVTVTATAARTMIDFNIIVNTSQHPPIGFVFYVFGAMCEKLPYMTSYIPNPTTVDAVRAQDFLKVPVNGNFRTLDEDFSIWLDVEAPSYTSGTQTFLDFEVDESIGGIGSNWQRAFSFFRRDGYFITRIHRAATDTVTWNFGRTATRAAIAFVRRGGSYEIWQGGERRETGIRPATLPTVYQDGFLHIGSHRNGAEAVRLIFRGFRIYDFALTEAELGFLNGG